MKRSVTKKNFLIIGCAGYIAKKHIESIYQLNHSVVAAFDLNSNVGFLDSYSKNIHFLSVCKTVQKVIESVQYRLHIIKLPTFSESICS